MGIISYLASKFATRGAVQPPQLTLKRTLNRRTRRAMASIARRQKPRGYPHIQPEGFTFRGQRG